MKLSKNFSLQEFVHPDIYDMGESLATKFIDSRMIVFAQALRDRLGSGLIINNWHIHGPYKLSGVRPFDTTVGARWSQHKFGRAIDLKGVSLSTEEIYEEVRKNWVSIYRDTGVTRMEHIDHTPTWVHVDCAYTDSPSLTIFNP